MHLIPADRTLWRLDRFDDFVKERKKLIAEKFRWLLVSEASQRRAVEPAGNDRIQKSMAYLIDAGAI